jgi:lipoteichoic acid synthase
MLLRIGPLIASACLAAYRAAWLSTQISGFQWREVGFLLLADAAVLGCLLLLAPVEARFSERGRVLASVAAVAAVLIVYAFHVADVATVRVLNARLQLADLRTFAREWWVVPGFLTAWTVVVIALAAAAVFVKVRVPRRIARLMAGAGAALLLVPLAVPAGQIPSYLHKYTGSVLLLGRELWGSRPQTISRYSAGDYAAYRDEYEHLFDAPFARTGTDVVLVIVESLSAADSARTSGLRNLLPDLDALSRNGTLFRNFIANFEASEGGIVSLLSGVPPVHFPTASTNTFGEYAMQRGIVASFARAGYQTEFLTSVPLQFIAMDRYARSPSVGFRFAAGQHETERFRDAPRFAFLSPGDHVLYEEVLSRIDSSPASAPPRLTAVLTASSHAPYVDPLGRLDTEENVWTYVQRELRWLHDELARRGFFEHGVMIITGDHRRMTPVTQAERERYGESAKARVPLIVIGTGVPRDRVDDRWLQQADLLRMLDRVPVPDAALSPFALWVERYVFVFGVAANASHLQVFVPDDGGREAFRLNLLGPWIDWLSRPRLARDIERAVHRQRALQQVSRAATLTPPRVTVGRSLSPGDQQGMLVGHSSDVNISRDPDDPAGGLRTFPARSLDLEELVRQAGAAPGSFTLSVRAFLPVPADGEYWFSLFADDEGCLAVDGETVLECHAGINEGSVVLTAGTHRLDLRYVYRQEKRSLNLKWLTPRAQAFAPLPQELLRLPRIGS